MFSKVLKPLPKEPSVSRYQLAQLNVGTIKGPIDSPVMAEFVANLDRINALAEQSPGFVWRLKTDEGNATSLSTPLGENVIPNMSVWEDVASLNHYVYKTAHVEIMKRRKEWFERMHDAYMVLWWVPHGHRPTVDEAVERLRHFRAFGATPHAFSFRDAHPAPDAASDAAAPSFGDACPAT
jgi:hypothetical protein